MYTITANTYRLSNLSDCPWYQDYPCTAPISKLFAWIAVPGTRIIHVYHNCKYLGYLTCRTVLGTRIIHVLFQYALLGLLSQVHGLSMYTITANIYRLSDLSDCPWYQDYPCTASISKLSAWIAVPGTRIIHVYHNCKYL